MKIEIRTNDHHVFGVYSEEHGWLFPTPRVEAERKRWESRIYRDGRIRANHTYARMNVTEAELKNMIPFQGNFLDMD